MYKTETNAQTQEKTQRGNGGVERDKLGVWD